jgi:hypothetical protein
MSERIDVDQVLADWLQDGAFSAPDAPIEAAIAHARQHPRRRTFGIFRRDALAPLGRTGLRPAAIAAALVILALSALLIVAIGAFLRNNVVPVASPSPTPTASSPLVSPTPTVTPPARPSPSTSSEPFMRAIEPGTSLPAAWLGSWYESSLPGFPWFLRAGDPYCVTGLSTTQDCMVWELGDGSGHFVNTGIVTQQNGNFAVRWIGGNCNNNNSRYTPVLVGNRLTLTWVGGTCNSGNYVFTRTGAGGAPTAPPQPTP